MHISLHNIHKRFGATTAVGGVDLDLKPGEIHALLGENGAGKTTLMNMLYGMLSPDEGVIKIDAVPQDIQTPGHAIDLGIGMIHQHFTLVPVFTAMENLILGEQRTDRWWLRRQSTSDEIRALSQKYGLAIDPDIPVWQLSVGGQQRVEILKALRRGAQTLILDEPTAVLTPQEVKELFAVLRQFRTEGKTIVFISHKLQEVMKISDRITVLRHGQVVETAETSAMTPDILTRLMIGKDIEQVVPSEQHPSEETTLVVERLRVKDERNTYAVNDVSFQIHKGEILGIAGVDGNGQRELSEALTGLRQAESGHIILDGIDITHLDIQERAIHQVASIPQDRQKTGLILNFSIEENLVLSFEHIRRHSRHGVLDTIGIHDEAQRLIKTFDIRTSDSRLPVSTLSGGNQQKVVFARELSRASNLLVAFNPTRGVDVNAMTEIHRRLIERRSTGLSILLISSELDEILTLSDRIAVLYNGRIMGVVPSGTDRQIIGGMMAGVAKR